MWATNKDGEGRVEKLGVYDDIEDIEILVGHFAGDVVITLEFESEE